MVFDERKEIKKLQKEIKIAQETKDAQKDAFFQELSQPKEKINSCFNQLLEELKSKRVQNPDGSFTFDVLRKSKESLSPSQDSLIHPKNIKKEKLEMKMPNNTEKAFKKPEGNIYPNLDSMKRNQYDFKLPNETEDEFYTCNTSISSFEEYKPPLVKSAAKHYDFQHDSPAQLNKKHRSKREHTKNNPNTLKNFFSDMSNLIKLYDESQNHGESHGNGKCMFPSNYCESEESDHSHTCDESHTCADHTAYLKAKKRFQKRKPKSKIFDNDEESIFSHNESSKKNLHRAESLEKINSSPVVKSCLKTSEKQSQNKYDTDTDTEIEIPRDLLRDLKNLKSYSGFPRDRKLDTFLRELEAQVRVCASKSLKNDKQRLDAVMAQILKFFLTDDALLSFSGLTNKEQASYKLAKAALECRFGEKMPPTLIMNNLNNIRQHENMSIVALKEKIINWVEYYIRESMPNSSKHEKIQRREFLCHEKFLQALKEVIHDEIAITGIPVNFDDLVKKALEIETAFQMIKSRGRNNPSKSSATQHVMSSTIDDSFFDRRASRNRSGLSQRPNYQNNHFQNLNNFRQPPQFNPNIPPPYTPRGEVSSQNVYCARGNF